MTENNGSRLTQSAGWILILGALLIIVFMLHHPTVGTHDPREVLERMQEISRFNAFIHGGLILLLIGMLYGVSALVERLGRTKALPRAGMIFFFLGVIGYCLAALISGFAQAGIAERYLDADHAGMQMASALRILNWEFNQAFANAGAVATSLGIALISLSMALRGGLSWWVGVFGLALGLVSAGLLLLGHLTLQVTGMTLVAGGQSAWYLGCGVLMVFGELKDRKVS